jgi:uncharacterized SAM-binding protein YcdF (DUF218 family)
MHLTLWFFSVAFWVIELMQLFRKQTVWVPTRIGYLSVLVAGLLPLIAWWLYGERFLSCHDTRPAEILMVEGWIGLEGLHAAKDEFVRGGYKYLVTTGGDYSTRWDTRSWNYADEARKVLLSEGVSSEIVISGRTHALKSQRTFAAMLGAVRTLEAKGIPIHSITVFTIGAHARRSKLVLGKVVGTEVHVGAISWVPVDYDNTSGWWSSSERAQDFIKESVAYPYELLLNSGRFHN